MGQQPCFSVGSKKPHFALLCQKGAQPAFQRNLRRSLATRFEPAFKILNQDPVLHLGLCHDDFDAAVSPRPISFTQVSSRNIRKP